MKERNTAYDNLKGLMISDIEAAFELFSSGFKEEKEEYKAEFDGDRSLRPSQVGLKRPKPKTEISKIPFNFQKKIVRTATSFLFNKPITLEVEDDNIQKLIDTVFKENRFNTLLQNFTRTLKSETEAVFFIFKVKKNDGEHIKIRLYKFDNGQYAPLYDEYGDLIAFLWKYTTISGQDKTENAWIFTADSTVKYLKGEDGWGIIDTEPNIFQKIPVVFMRQDKPEWWEVKELIDRYEMSYSGFCDTNDYFGSPMIKLVGEVGSLPRKESQGKAIKIPKQVDGHGNDITGDVDYLTWEYAPESIKLETEMGKNAIHDMTSTPDISFSNLKTLAPASGLAMKMQFFDAELKADESFGEFSEMIKRIASLIITLSGNKYKGSIEVKRNSPLPSADAEVIDNLVTATAGKAIISQKTAVHLNPLVEYPDAELKLLGDDETKDLAESFNV